MAESSKELVVVMTRGTDHELSSVAFTIANGGMTAGLKVYIFLTSAAVDLARKRAVEVTHVPPLEPLQALVADFLRRGGTLWACTPCVKGRGHAQFLNRMASRAVNPGWRRPTFPPWHAISSQRRAPRPSRKPLKGPNSSARPAMRSKRRRGSGSRRYCERCAARARPKGVWTAISACR